MSRGNLEVYSRLSDVLNESGEFRGDGLYFEGTTPSGEQYLLDSYLGVFLRESARTEKEHRAALVGRKAWLTFRYDDGVHFNLLKPGEVGSNGDFAIDALRKHLKGEPKPDEVYIFNKEAIVTNPDQLS